MFFFKLLWRHTKQPWKGAELPHPGRRKAAALRWTVNGAWARQPNGGSQWERTVNQAVRNEFNKTSSVMWHEEPSSADNHGEPRWARSASVRSVKGYFKGAVWCRPLAILQLPVFLRCVVSVWSFRGVKSAADPECCRVFKVKQQQPWGGFGLLRDYNLVIVQ